MSPEDYSKATNKDSVTELLNKKFQFIEFVLLLSLKIGKAGAYHIKRHIKWHHLPLTYEVIRKTSTSRIKMSQYAQCHTNGVSLTGQVLAYMGKPGPGWLHSSRSAQQADTKDVIQNSRRWRSQGPGPQAGEWAGSQGFPAPWDTVCMRAGPQGCQMISPMGHSVVLYLYNLVSSCLRADHYPSGGLPPETVPEL